MIEVTTPRRMHPALLAHRAEVASLKKAAIQPIKDAAKAARRSGLNLAKRADRERNRKVLR